MKKLIFLTLTLLYTGTSYGACWDSAKYISGPCASNGNDKTIQKLEKRISDLESKNNYKYKSWDGNFAFNNKKSQIEYNHGNFKKCVFVGGDDLLCFK